MKIPLTDIAVIRRQRTKLDAEKLDELIKSIKGRGRLIHPIVVRKRLEDERYPEDHPLKGEPLKEPYILMVGGRRYAAHMSMGWKEIEANVFDDMDELEQQIIELEENLARAPLTWEEELNAKARIHDLRLKKNPNQRLVDTAKELGEDKGNLSKDLKLHRMIQADPTLKAAPTKKAALRKASFTKEMERRVAAIKMTDVGALKERLVTQDMRHFIRQLTSQSVDLLFPDFPFGIDYDKVSGHQNPVRPGLYEDSPKMLRDLLADVVPHMIRVVKPGGWIAAMMGWSNYKYLEELMVTACGTHCGYADKVWDEDEQRWKRDGHPCVGQTRELRSDEPCRFLTPEILPWIWHRPNSRQPSLWPELHAGNAFELIMVVNGGAAKLVRPGCKNVLMHDAVYVDRVHEMQRPGELCEDIIQRLTVTGELVVDLCFGSGQHLASAAKLGRDFKGCDVDPKNLPVALALVGQFYTKSVTDAAVKGRQNAQQSIKGLADAEAEAAENEDDLSDITDEEAANL